mgnify:CR=1 FL=1
MKQFSQIKEEQGFMMAQAQYYRNERIKSMTDEKYGEGTADFLAQAIEAFLQVKIRLVNEKHFEHFFEHPDRDEVLKAPFYQYL